MEKIMNFFRNIDLKNSMKRIISFFRNLDLKNNKVYGYIRKYGLYVVAMLALLFPDLPLRFCVYPKVYGTSDEIFRFARIIPLLFDLGWISLFLYFSLVFLPKKWGRVFYIVVGSIFLVFAFAEYIFFQIDGHFFRVNSIGLAGETTDYLSFAIKRLDLRLGLSVLFSVLCLVLTGLWWERPKHTGVVAKCFVVVPMLLIFGVHLYMSPDIIKESDQDWNSWGKPRIVYREFNDPNKGLDITGLYHFTLRDIYKSYFAKNSYSEEDYLMVDEFFAKNQAEYAENEYAGIFEGKNVIAVMLEGIDDWMITEKHTPTMKKMMDEGINFASYYAPDYGTGKTFNSEFCFNTGYYTPISHVTAVNFNKNAFPYALPRLFRNKGYSVNSYHYNNPEYYNRGIMHSSMGYEKYHSFQEFGMSEIDSQSDSKILANDAVYNDMVGEKPFFSFVIAYSGHVPYWNDAKMNEAKKNHTDLVDPNSVDLSTFNLTEKNKQEEAAIKTQINNCHILAADTDDFFRILLERLEADGLMDDTVIVVFTDHYAYGFDYTNILQQLNAKIGDPTMYQVPAFIYAKGIEPVVVKKPTQTADFVPTLINLFGLENNHCYIGRDMLAPIDREPGFVYFGNLSWIEGNGEEENDGEASYRYDPSHPVDEKVMERAVQGNLRMQNSLKINDIVIAGDYFGHRKK